LFDQSSSSGFNDKLVWSIGMGHGFPPLPPQHVSKGPFAAPNSRKKWSGREKMRQPNQAGPKNRDQAQD